MGKGRIKAKEVKDFGMSEIAEERRDQTQACRPFLLQSVIAEDAPILRENEWMEVAHAQHRFAQLGGLDMARP